MSQAPTTRSAADPYLHTTVEATVHYRERDFVDVHWQLPDWPEGRGRLYQRDSLVHSDDAPLLEYLPQYAPGQRVRVYVSQRITRANRLAYHVHERWADAANPWDQLNLYEDDVVSGTVTKAIISQDQLKGWLVQLDAGKTFPEAADAGLQPDIEVYLPLEEIPWADGRISENAVGEARLPLLRGERVLLWIFQIDAPPRNPRGSILRLIHHRDAQSLALAQATRPLPTPALAMRASPIVAGLLRGYVIWIVDDEDAQMQRLAQRLQANGAKTKCFLVSPGNWANSQHQTVQALQDSVLTAHLSGNRAPDLVLVDLHLLQQDSGGIQLIQAWQAAAPHQAAPCALLSSFINCATPVVGCRAALLRPLEMGVLRHVLQGEPVWQTASRHNDASFAVGQRLQINPATWLQQLRHDTEADFAVLLAASGAHDLSWVAAAGNAPLSSNNLPQAFEHSELRLLLAGHLAQLLLTPNQQQNAALKAPGSGHGLWLGLQDPINPRKQADWILGLGGRSALPAPMRPWLARYAAQALSQMRQAEGMNDLATLLSKGMRFDSLAHEWLRRQSQADEMLAALQAVQQNMGNDAASVSELHTWLATNLPQWQAASQEMQQTADMMLDVQRTRHTELDLSAILQMLYPLAKASCDAREVQLDWPAEVPALALALPASAISVPLLNLIDNAAKHHVRHENNRVTVQVALPQDGTNANCLVVSVLDNSFGLNAVQEANLFQPLRSTAIQTERHGIGLWLAQQVVQKFGGHMNLAATWRGIGSRFDLVLPMRLEGELEQKN